MSDYTPYQQKVIKRYYENRSQIAEQRLAELVSELFLTTGKKLDRLWESTAATLAKVGVPQSRIDHILKVRDPALVAGVVEELQGKQG